ncbi:hypothetical protein KR222_004919 [Zaprionus bogoriensis]|nr:hypothetical protein KR222_004919 [Zaprionus bogoriensis]
MLLSMLSFLLNSANNCMSSILNYAYESNYIMALVSCSMALVAIVHLKSASIIFSDICGNPAETYVEPPPLAPSTKSPVNILHHLTLLQRQQQHERLAWHCYDQLPPAVLMENNGSTVIMRISCSPDYMPHLSDGGLEGNYYFVEAVFKWGPSEHRIDSRQYALEMQVLHASNRHNGPFEYLTIAYLFMLSRHQNKQLQQVVENLGAIRHTGSIIELPPFDLCSLLWPFNGCYYSYYGSYSNGSIVLPTQWYVCTRIFGVADAQLEAFQSLIGSNGHRLVHNSRCEQPLDNRCICFVN